MCIVGYVQDRRQSVFLGRRVLEFVGGRIVVIAARDMMVKKDWSRHDDRVVRKRRAGGFWVGSGKGLEG